MSPRSMAIGRQRAAAVDGVVRTDTLSRPRPAIADPAEDPRSLLGRVWQGPAGEPRIIRLTLITLLVVTACLYLAGPAGSGWANPFYSAAAQAGSESWKALFFGSSDAANSITVDKPPASLWVMALSVRVFGLSSWSILVPQALMGVASVGLLYGTVRRAVNPAAGLIAGAVLALTPGAALMFRFNNPDALLTLLMIGAAAATYRAIDSTRSTVGPRHATRWLALAGVLVGFAFLTKMLEAFLVVPGFAVAFLLMSDQAYGYAKRVRDLALALVALVVSAGWWIAIVAWWPAASRPYIGGTRHNSILELTLGYNGFGRLTGGRTSAPGDVAFPGFISSPTGWLRMLETDVGLHIGWLLPTAFLLLAAGMWVAVRERITGATTALVIWGGWLLAATLTFSYMKGIFHAYYTVALAPAIGAVVGTGAVLLWQRRGHYAAAFTMAAATLVSSGTSFILLGRTPDFVPWLRWVIAAAGLGTALLLCGLRRMPGLTRVVAGLALTVMLTGPESYTVSATGLPQSGSIPTLGAVDLGSISVMASVTPSAAVRTMLERHSGDYTWALATIGSNNAAGYQLATQLPVMPIGGFDGGDPTPTLAGFKALVAAGRIHYFVPAAAADLAATGTSSGSITRWVTSSFAATRVGGIRVYDVSGGPG